MSEKELDGVEDLEETVKRTDAQLDLMSWKMDNVEQQLTEQQLTAQPLDGADACVMNLMKSVSEQDKLPQVRQDYQQLRQELVEVQALQRELSGRLRAQLRLVHGKFARLRQRLAQVTPR